MLRPRVTLQRLFLLSDLLQHRDTRWLICERSSLISHLLVYFEFWSLLPEWQTELPEEKSICSLLILTLTLYNYYVFVSGMKHKYKSVTTTVDYVWLTTLWCFHSFWPLTVSQESSLVKGWKVNHALETRKIFSRIRSPRCGLLSKLTVKNLHNLAKVITVFLCLSVTDFDLFQDSCSRLEEGFVVWQLSEYSKEIRYCLAVQIESFLRNVKKKKNDLKQCALLQFQRGDY